MSKFAWILMLATLTIGPSAVAQTAIPDLRGTWKGDSEFNNYRRRKSSSRRAAVGTPTLEHRRFYAEGR